MFIIIIVVGANQLICRVDMMRQCCCDCVLSDGFTWTDLIVDQIPDCVSCITDHLNVANYK